MPKVAPGKPSAAREKLLDTAGELFYAEGVHAVGVDRVIDESGVSKATLYAHFKNKDGLVGSYLMRHHEGLSEWIERELERRYDTPEERILGVFTILGESFARAQFRGCAFVNASAEEDVGDAVRAAADYNRTWVKMLFRGLARDAGYADPAALSQQLSLLYLGSTVAARMDRDPTMAAAARDLAAALLGTAPKIKD